jgi:glycerol-3-phosphate acyltransferase PlsX
MTNKSIKLIALDAMGGDYGPKATVPATIKCVTENAINVVLVGDETKIKHEFKNFPKEITEKLKIVPAEGIVLEGESPVKAYRNKPNASVFVAAGLVKNGFADGFVSMGSSGATMAAATLLFGTIEGIERGSVGGPVIGYSPEMVIIDLGSNVDTRPNQLVDFAAISCEVSKIIFNKKNPKVGLLSIGSEKGKGNLLVKETYELLSKSSLNFIGNIEANELFDSKIDAVVCDGFVGNIVLKLTEGLGRVISNEILESTNNKKLSDKIYKKTNLLEFFGGGPIYGLNGVAIIGHGKSNVSTISNAIKTSDMVIENNWVERQRIAIKKIRSEIN